MYSYNYLGLEVFRVAGTEAMAAGRHQHLLDTPDG